MRTAVSTLLTFCPPLPPARIVVISRSSSFTSMSISSSMSGVTSTAAKAVCRRAFASNGRDADEPVHAVLAAQVPEGVVARDAEAHAVDPGLVALLVVDDLGLVAAALAPAQVHAEQHLRPVLRVGAAGARVDARRWRWRDRRGPRASARAPRSARARSSAGSGASASAIVAVVVLGGAELEQDLRVVDVARELLEGAERLLEAASASGSPPAPSFGRPRSRARASARSSVVDLVLQLGEVKDAPLAP